tara:strand:- start:2960 stop:3103 length:144 start_codon:yes stop_codon:yes gene_type:complete
MSYQRNPRKLQKVNENANGNVQDSQGEKDKTVPVQQNGDGASKKDGE